MAKTAQEILKGLETGKENAIRLRDAATAEVIRLVQKSQELRASIKSDSTPKDQKRRDRAALALSESDLRAAQREVQSQTVLIGRIDVEIAKVKKSMK